jgi:hypothetical protein
MVQIQSSVHEQEKAESEEGNEPAFKNFSRHLRIDVMPTK